MKAIVVMFDSLNRHMLPPYADSFVHAPNFERLANRTVTFDNFYAGSMPCMPARRELHTGRYNFLHRGWGPLEPFDDSMPEMLRRAGVHTHLTSDHPHYWEDGGATYHTRFSTWEFFRGQEGDPWKGVVEPNAGGDLFSRMRRQDQVNRRYMESESEHSQTLTVDAGLHFIETNAAADRWMLQIEMFDPHEPFFTHQEYKDLYPHPYDGPEFDWPAYQKVTEGEDQVEHARREYAALVSMCDRSLGRILDAMDEHDLWDDTMLIVNTDHGFLLGEHGWWAKSVQPWYNELVHLPMFLWDPREARDGERRDDLSQTIDIAPTLLGFFGVPATADMQGRDLSTDASSREAALFGIHGGHVNVTDGRYVYMRASATVKNEPIEDFTLMPTHMRSRFSVKELQNWEPAAPFPFTKGLRTMRINSVGRRMNPWLHGTLLFDLATDPDQLQPIVDDAAELRMLGLLVEEMRRSDAPASQFMRLGLPQEGLVSAEHLAARADAERAAATAEPLPSFHGHPAEQLLTASVHQLLMDATVQSVLDEHLPWLTNTELVASMPNLSLLGIAASGSIPASALVAIADDLVLAMASERADA